MIMRLTTAALGFALALQVTSTEARPYYGYDGRNYGELEKLPDYGRPKPAEPARDAKGAPRACLTSAARALLERIESNFGPVSVISTCRPGARIAGSGRISRHASGNAVDFEAGARKGAIVSWLIANHHAGGTMTYGDMSHIHVDIGQHFVSLASPSGGGRARRRTGSSQRYAYRSSRGYVGEGRVYGYRAVRYGGAPHGSQYASGYATIY
jgi:hypothetical protein